MIRNIVLSFVALSMLCISAQAAPPSNYVLIFDDEFNGTSLDATKWYPPVNQQDYSYPGISAEMLVANVSVHDGVLDLAVTKGPTIGGFAYGTAAVTTKGTVIPSKGVYWEARIKNMDNAVGLASTFWTDTSPSFSFPEVDFNEYWQSQGVYLTRQNYNDGSSWLLQAVGGENNSDLASAYHIYGCLWTPSEISYFIDGNQTARTVSNTQQSAPVWLGILNAAVMGTLGPNTVLPNHLLVDWIHVYQAP